MKKGNRVLALLLAVVLVVTGITWDFSNNVVVANADNTTTTESLQPEKINFENIDVTTLDDKFKSYLSGASTADASVGTNWFSGKTGTGADGSNVKGLKTKKKNTVYNLKYNEAYQNFQVSIEMYPDTNTQVGVGNLTSNGVSSDSQGAVMFWFTDNHTMKYRGAGKTTTTANLPTNQSVFTLNIRVENKKLTAWIDGTDFSTSFNVNSNFPNKSNIVFRQKRNSDGGVGGGYKSFEVRNLDAAGYTAFDYVDVSNLTDFKATQLRKSEKTVVGSPNQAVSALWYSGRTATVDSTNLTSKSAGIKPKAKENNSYIHLLNYKDSYENFRTTVEIYRNDNIGVVIGNRNSCPNASSSEQGVRLWIANNTIALQGALDWSDYTYKLKDAEINTASTSNQRNIQYADSTPAYGAVVKLNLEVKDGYLKVWVSGYNMSLKVKLSSSYPAESTVALWSVNYNTGYSGGFKSFAFQDLDATTYNLTHVDVSTLTDFTATQLKKNTAEVVGNPDQAVSALWFSGNDAAVAGGTVSGRTGGLKAKAKPTNTYDHLLNYKNSYENFQVSTEINFGEAMGIRLGAKNTYPTDVTSPAIYLSFTNYGTIQFKGAFDGASGVATGTSDPKWVSQEDGAYYLYRYVAEASKPAASQKCTLNIKMQDGVLTVWVSEYDTKLTVNVTEDYPEISNIALWSRNYDSTSRGFRTFSIKELPSIDTGTGTEVDIDKDGTRYTNFDNVKSSILNEKGFTSTRYSRTSANPIFTQVAGAIDIGASKHWTSENGLKTKANSSDNRYYLNTPYTYENFTISTDVYLGQTVGVALGEGTSSPSNSSKEDTSVVVYFYNNNIYICGAVDTTDRIVTGTNGASSSLSGKTILFTFDKTYKMEKNEVKTLHVEMLDGILTVWVDGYDGKISVPATEKYQSGNIALLAQKSSEGGFKTFSIQELQASQQDDANNFESMQQVEEMFDAYYLKNAKESSKMEKVNIDDHWSLSYRGILSRKTSSTGYTVTDDVEVLTYTQREFTDFEMTYTYQQNWLRLGVAIGEDLGEYPLSYTNGKLTADKGAVVFFEAEGYSNVQGHLNNTNNKESLLYRVKEPTPDGFQDVSSNISARKLHTVKIVVKDKALYIFLDGSEEPACYTHLGDNYKGGYVSLIAHAPSGYGFKNFAITDKITTTLPAGGGVSVSGNTVTVDFNSAKFDDSNFETYYLAKTKQNADGIMEKQDFEDQWTIDNGVLESNNKLPMPGSDNLTEFEYDDAAMVSVLTYNKKMTNFIATYDYQKTPRRMMFMFGAEMGKYALAAQNTTERGQGILIYPENDLGTGGGIVALGNLATYTSSMRPSARTKVYVDGYHEAGKWASNVGTWHTMTVAVINGHCYIYLDDYGMIADYELSDYEGGYISLATTGRGASFDNLKITDLSTLSENDIIAGENPSDITVLVGTDASALGLPTSVKATTKIGKTVDVPVTWKSLNYNASEAGVYQFTAVLDDKTNVGVKINVRVVTEMQKTQSGVKYWTFDTEDDLKDFKAYYLKNAETGYITENVPNWYVNSSGRLTRDPFRAVNGDQYKEIAILTYTGEKYTNFELEVEYTQQWQRMMVLFGSEKVGQYIDLKDIYAASNPVAGFVEMEGVRNFIGNLINANFDSNDKEKINNARESGVRLENYYDKVLYGGNQGKKHTMKIRVVGDQAMMWVDNAEVPYVCTLTNYDGGYISLVTTSKSGSFDNLKITRLNAKGEPEAADPNAVASGTMNVSIDATASTELVVPEKVKPESYEDILIGGDKEVVIPTIAYVVGGSTILLAVIIGSLFILTALKKKKKES